MGNIHGDEHDSLDVVMNAIRTLPAADILRLKEWLDRYVVLWKKQRGSLRYHEEMELLMRPEPHRNSDIQMFNPLLEE